jgi:hypothetical protein
MDKRIEAVRGHKLVGRGSCTSVDECLEDAELAKMFDEDGVETPTAAIKWALEFEGMHLEQGLNARCGDDDDPQLANWQAWNSKLEEA